MEGIIYKITSPSGSVYIGQTVDWYTRLRKYKGGRCPYQKILFASIKKYGWDAHSVEFLETEDHSELDRLEIFYIDKFKSNKNKFPNGNGMNLCDGGGGIRGAKFKWKNDSIKGVSGVNHWAYGTKKEYVSERNRLKRGTKNPSHSEKLKGNNCRGRIVLDTQTGVYYESAEIASRSYNINPYNLRKKLNGERMNNTPLVYV